MKFVLLKIADDNLRFIFCCKHVLVCIIFNGGVSIYINLY